MEPWIPAGELRGRPGAAQQGAELGGPGRQSRAEGADSASSRISYRLMNKPDEAIKSIQDSMEITRKMGMKRCWRQPRGIGGESDHHRQARCALTNFNQSLQILREIGMQKDLGNILLNRGVPLPGTRRPDKALQDYKDACKSSAIRRTLICRHCVSAISRVYSRRTIPTTRSLTTASLQRAKR